MLLCKHNHDCNKCNCNGNIYTAPLQTFDKQSEQGSWPDEKSELARKFYRFNLLSSGIFPTKQNLPKTFFSHHGNLLSHSHCLGRSAHCLVPANPDALPVPVDAFPFSLALPAFSATFPSMNRIKCNKKNV